MKVIIDGIEQKLHPSLHCTGYRAEAISLDDADLRELAKLNHRDLYATIQQLAGRVRPYTLPGQPVRFSVAEGERLEVGDAVGINERGELQKAVPGINYIGNLPPTTVFRPHFVQVPEDWPSLIELAPPASQNEIDEQWLEYLRSGASY